ncbi:MAG: GFA family protein [Rhodocyclaceae bacterium]|nr:GFA family protein [Rhodocyclaceae bacterium]
MTAVCHCKHCQRQTGTAFSVVVAVPRGSLVMEGAEPHVYFDTGTSGKPVLRKFCPQCGSPLVSEAAAAPDLDFIKAGTLDDTSWLKPQVNIWCDSAQPWVQMSEDVPRVPQNPAFG